MAKEETLKLTAENKEKHKLTRQFDAEKEEMQDEIARLKAEVTKYEGDIKAQQEEIVKLRSGKVEAVKKLISEKQNVCWTRTKIYITKINISKGH